MADKKGTKRKTPGRIYLTEEETKVLESFLGEWSEKPDKRSCNAFVVTEVLPKVQSLDLDRFGPDIISRDKQAKQLWESRIKVRTDIRTSAEWSFFLHRRFLSPSTCGSRTIGPSKTEPSSDWKEKSPFAGWLER